MRRATLPALLLLPLLLIGRAAPAQDVREAMREARADRAAARAEAAAAEARIFADRDSLQAAVARLESRRAALTDSLAALDREAKRLDRERAGLEDEWSRREMDFHEISGNVRTAARDLESALRRSPLTAADPQRLDPLERLLKPGYFPGIDDVSAMAAACFDEIARTGEVSLRELPYVGRDGRDARGRVLTIGPFTAAYENGGETGFLLYAPESARFLAQEHAPSRGVRRALRRYMAGRSDLAPVDISGGAAVRQAASGVSFGEQLRQGGPIVWPILLIALLALGIVVERVLFLRRVHGNTTGLMDRVNELADAGDWDACDRLVDEHAGRGWPVVRVLRAGLAARGEDRETLESVLQESILHELPRLERWLALLAVFGAVAPLLGLLGTVTGMIDTFRVITLFGTGDPKLMSGGISEALITTEIGLAVAIPIMLMHTLLSRRVDHVVGDMEEKAVALTNAVQKSRR